MNERVLDIFSDRNVNAYGAWVGLGDVKRTRTKDMPWSRRKLAPRQHLFLQGDERHHVYRLRSGFLRLYATLNDGRRQIVAFKSAGEFVALEYGPKHRYSAQAVSTAELQYIPVAEFYAAAARDQELLLRVYRLVSADLSLTHDLLVTVGKRDAEESMANFLLGLETRTAAQGGKSEFILLPMLHGDLADYLGLTSETVSRIFTNFKKRGLIEVKGRHGIRLSNRRGLREIVARNGGKGPG